MAAITHIGCVVYPGFQGLDLIGPLDPLSILSMDVPFQFYVIGPSLAPVSTHMGPFLKTASPSFGVTIVPTHTFDNPPEKLDLLIVPGGVGWRTVEQPCIDFVKATYPKLQYILSVCTGATILGRAGILEGKRATSNKAAWAYILKNVPNVEWVPKARWVVDGNIWTTSGVAAGIDGIFAWISQTFGEEAANKVAGILEVERHTDASWDPFADMWRVTDPDHGASVQHKF